MAFHLARLHVSHVRTVVAQREERERAARLQHEVEAASKLAAESEAKFQACDKERKTLNRKLTTASERLRVLEDESAFHKELNTSLQSNHGRWQEKVRAEWSCC